MFPFCDEAKNFIRLSKKNLELGYTVVDELKERNIKDLQMSGGKRSRGSSAYNLIIDFMVSGKPYENVRTKYPDEERKLS